MPLIIDNNEGESYCYDKIHPMIFEDEASAIHYLQEHENLFKNKPEWFVKEQINFKPIGDSK